MQRFSGYCIKKNQYDSIESNQEKKTSWNWVDNLYESTYHIEPTKFQKNKLNISWEQNNHHQKRYAQQGIKTIMLPWLYFFLGHAFFSSTSQNKKGPATLFQVPRFKCVVSRGRHICEEKGYSTQNKKRSQVQYSTFAANYRVKSNVFSPSPKGSFRLCESEIFSIFFYIIVFILLFIFFYFGHLKHVSK